MKPVIGWTQCSIEPKDLETLYLVVYHNNVRGGGTFVSICKAENIDGTIVYKPIESCGMINGAQMHQNQDLKIIKPLSYSNLQDLFKEQEHMCKKCKAKN